MSGTDEFANAVEAGSGGGESWKPENVGDVVFGTYRAMKTNVGKHNSNVYVIQEDGKDETTSVWGSTVIDGRFEEIPVGSRVKIEFWVKYLASLLNTKTTRSYMLNKKYLLM